MPGTRPQEQGGRRGGGPGRGDAFVTTVSTKDGAVCPGPVCMGRAVCQVGSSDGLENVPFLSKLNQVMQNWDSYEGLIDSALMRLALLPSATAWRAPLKLGHGNFGLHFRTALPGQRRWTALSLLDCTLPATTGQKPSSWESRICTCLCVAAQAGLWAHVVCGS
jgi:hypothetical protein